MRRPVTSPVSEFAWAEIEMPKSPILTRPCSSTKQLDGFTSRCRMPAVAAASSPAMTWRMASTAMADGSRPPCFSRSASVSRMSSMAMTSRPSSSQAPKT